MSRTFKDKKEEKAKRINKAPQFKRSYRNVLENGFPEDGDSDRCPECGAAVNFDRGFRSCEECNWGSFFPEEPDADGELEFSDVA